MDVSESKLIAPDAMRAVTSTADGIVKGFPLLSSQTASASPVTEATSASPSSASSIVIVPVVAAMFCAELLPAISAMFAGFVAPVMLGTSFVPVIVMVTVCAAETESSLGALPLKLKLSSAVIV